MPMGIGNVDCRSMDEQEIDQGGLAGASGQMQGSVALDISAVGIAAIGDQAFGYRTGRRTRTGIRRLVGSLDEVGEGGAPNRIAVRSGDRCSGKAVEDQGRLLVQAPVNGLEDGVPVRRRQWYGGAGQEAGDQACSQCAAG